MALTGFCLGAAKAKPMKGKKTARYFMVRNLLGYKEPNLVYLWRCRGVCSDTSR